jgi:hypothetical protein
MLAITPRRMIDEMVPPDATWGGMSMAKTRRYLECICVRKGWLMRDGTEGSGGVLRIRLKSRMRAVGIVMEREDGTRLWQ